MEDELARESDDGPDRLLVERLGHGAERAGEAVGNLFRVGGQEDDRGAVLGDEPLRDLRPGHAVQQVHVDQGQVRSFALGDREGAGPVHGATNHIAPAVGEHELQFHGQERLVLDDHDPQVGRLGHSIPPR